MGYIKKPVNRLTQHKLNSLIMHGANERIIFYGNQYFIVSVIYLLSGIRIISYCHTLFCNLFLFVFTKMWFLKFFSYSGHLSKMQSSQ